MSFTETIAQLRELGDSAGVSFDLISNQPDGRTSFATGALRYEAIALPRIGADGSTVIGWRLVARNVPYLFDDRDSRSGQPPRPQPFAIEGADQLGLDLSATVLTPEFRMRMTLQSWGDASIDMTMREMDGILQGSGPGVGPSAPKATYLLAIYDPQEPLR